mmetsp:Transcript_13096/g.36842  ORF Transcript_13096/g.36842 Transcript_13096/m.36842 type:complete len:204 (+) Transcript_13096:513-1124(+)
MTSLPLNTISSNCLATTIVTSSSSASAGISSDLMVFSMAPALKSVTNFGRVPTSALNRCHLPSLLLARYTGSWESSTPKWDLTRSNSSMLLSAYMKMRSECSLDWATSSSIMAVSASSPADMPTILVGASGWKAALRALRMAGASPKVTMAGFVASLSHSSNPARSPVNTDSVFSSLLKATMEPDTQLSHSFRKDGSVTWAKP